MALTYPGDESSLRQKIARDYFLAALDDLYFEIRIRQPTDGVQHGTTPRNSVRNGSRHEIG